MSVERFVFWLVCLPFIAYGQARNVELPNLRRKL